MEVRFVVLSALLVSGASAYAVEKFPDRIVSTDGKPVKWTSDWPTDTRVEFLGATTLTLEMRCDLISKVYDCKEKAPNRTKVEFCFRYKDPAFKVCTKSLSKASSSEDVQLKSVTAQASFDPNSGGKVVFRNVAQDKQVPLVAASCTEWVESGSSMTSNQLFILDFRKNFPTRTEVRDSKVELRRKSASTLKCLKTALGIDSTLKASTEKHRQPAVPVKFDWFLCSGANPTECETSKTPLRNVASFSEWPVQVNADGNLYSPFVPAKIEPKLKNKRLMCYVMNKPAAFYSSPVNIVDSTNNNPFEMIRPYDTEKVMLYNSTSYSLTLPCQFKAPPTTVTFFWVFKKKKGGSISLFAGETYNDLRVSVSAQSDSITLNGPFSESSEGFLSCEVEIPGADDNLRTGQYELIIKGPPRPTPEIPSTKYLTAGDDATIRCLFQNPKRITPSLSVTGKEVQLKSQSSIDKDKAQINSDRKLWMPPIDFSVGPLNPEAGAVLTYNESKASYKENLDSTHVVTCIAEASPFKNRARVVFKVLPPAKLRLNVPKVCKVSCDLTAVLENGGAFKKECFAVTFSWSASKACPATGTPAYEGATWPFEASSSGRQSVCGCVHLWPPSGAVFNSTCKPDEMTVQVPFWWVRNPWMWIVILIIIAIPVALAVFAYWYLKKRNAAPIVEEKSLHERSTPEEVPLNRKGDNSELA